MIIQSGPTKINFEHFNYFDPDKKTILLLHGFTGSLEDWRSVSSSLDRSFNYIGIDLIGHGKSESPEEIEKYSASQIVKHIDDLAVHLSLKKIILLGYSMGGRAVLNFAVKYPGKVEALILESSTPGIEDEKLRKERIKKDEQIASFIGNHTIAEFANFWMNLELFSTQKRFSQEKRNQIKNEKIKSNPTGLANSLRGFGTGVMPPLFEQLKNIKCKTLLITGELDTKFTSINSDIVKLIENAEHKIIKNAGHNTHLEESERFTEAVNIFLRSFRN